MPKVLVGLAALLQATTPATAPNWRVVAYGANGSQVSTDLGRLTCRAALCSATELTEYLHPTTTGVARAVDDVQYDCSRASTRTLSETIFDTRGHQLGHLGAASPWALLEAGSMGYQAMTFACSPKTATHTSSAAIATVSTSPPAQGGSASSPLIPAGKPGAASVQIASGSTAESARSTLAALVRDHPEASSLRTQVEKATVRGRVTFRAELFGFGSQADALAFCQRLQNAAGCVVRAVRPGRPN